MTRPCNCKNFIPHKPLQESACFLCWYWHHIPEFRKMVGDEITHTPNTNKIDSTYPCSFRGDRTGERAACSEGCAKGTLIPVQSCSKFGKCTVAKRAEGVENVCRDCTIREFPAQEKDILPPSRITKLNSKLLSKGNTKDIFNPSMIEWNGKILLAYRTDQVGSDIWISILNQDLEVLTESVKLDLKHPRAKFGREDPRLFIHNNRLHISYIGVEGTHGPTTQLYALLDDKELKIEKIYHPNYHHRQRWEKNWSFFSHEDNLYSIYTIHPFTILEVKDEKTFTTITDKYNFQWGGGTIRGGASPVRVGEEYFSWFHGSKVVNGITTYNIGVYAFEAKPPFKITKHTPDPLLWANQKTRTRGWNKAVVFPCGAILSRNKWLVSYGVHDKEIEIGEWDHDKVLGEMKCLK